MGQDIHETTCNKNTSTNIECLDQPFTEEEILKNYIIFITK